MNRTNSNTDASKNQQLAIDMVDLAATAASFCNDNIMPVMEALVGLADFDSQDIGQNRIRINLINSLAKVGLSLVHDAAGYMEEERDRRQGALNVKLALAGGAQ